METFLVTGGAGFIGSHLADKLLEAGNKVIVIDNFDPYYERELKEKNIQHNIENKNYIFIEEDIRNTEKLKSIIKDHNIKKIFHIAARAGVLFSVKDPYSYHDINVNGTISLLKAAKDTGIERIVFASSSSVYGFVKGLPVTEQHPTRPLSPYGASKLASEAFCHAFMNVFKIPIVILRYFTVYGPRQRPDMAIRKFIQLIEKDEEITIYGNQSRDFTYVDDIVNGTIKAMNSSVIGIFNLGSTNRVSLDQLVSTIEEVTGKKAKKKIIDIQKGEIPDTWSDVSKARKEFGYEPTVNIKEGIKLFYSWFKTCYQ